MGSKTFLLSNGLGGLLLQECPKFERFVDPFCGSGAVTAFVATTTSVKVLASDLQAFAVALADATLSRDEAADPVRILNDWVGRAIRLRNNSEHWKSAQGRRKWEDAAIDVTEKSVLQARAMCTSGARVGPIWNAYGGYYFSPQQALTLDYLRKYLPERSPDRSIALSSLVRAASRCAASPGHTAQPFGLTPGGLSAIRDAWRKDIESIVNKCVKEICQIYAQTKGSAQQRDAASCIREANDGDLFFIDPPYSAVQYSRFYHVLETLTLGERVTVTGAGRYPPLTQRPSSSFSTRSAEKALDSLLKGLASKGSSVILTFPEGQASNGLSGAKAQEIGARYFNVGARKVANRFSTLGGSNNGREPRIDAKELILYLTVGK